MKRGAIAARIGITGSAVSAIERGEYGLTDEVRERIEIEFVTARE